MKNSILLITGAVITLLFIVLNTLIFEALYYERQFSDEMYNQNLYFVVAVVTVIFAWGLAAVFYYVINSVRFSRWWHWLAVLGRGLQLLGAVVQFLRGRSRSRGRAVRHRVVCDAVVVVKLSSYSYS